MKTHAAKNKQPQTKLREAFYTPDGAGSFSGNLTSLSKETGATKKEVRAWLTQQKVYNLHQLARKRFPTRRYLVRGLDSQWQADLVEMQAHERINDGHRYILTVVDVFSRYAWTRAVKRKTGPIVAEALESILQQGRKPIYLQTDQGLEFYNTSVKNMLKEYNVELFSVYSQHKAALVERFNRTLKGKMYRAFTHFGNYKWLDILPKLTESYNKSEHRSIGMAPVMVTKDNETDVWIQQYGDIKKAKGKPKFKLGDRVRISKQGNVFTRGFHPNWQEEVFTVHEINTKYISVNYKIRDYNNEVIQGSFYKHELQRVEDDELYRIEKVIRTRGTGARKEALVKWLGYPETNWIKYSELRSIRDI